jgi:hypothetical protein
MSDTPGLTLAETVASGFIRDYEIFAERVRAIADGLSEDEFWTRPRPYGNSIAHLTLHITGNLHYYIGTQIAGTGYVRDRPREFAETIRRPKADVLAALDEAVAMVVRTIRAQRVEDWTLPYAAVGADAPTRFGMVLRCGEHFFHHLGQMIYLKKEHEDAR